MSRKNKYLSEGDIEDEYSLIEADLKNLLIQLRQTLEHIVDESEIKLGFPIEGRVKSLESLLSKKRKGEIHLRRSIKNIQDLVGFRMVLIFKSDVSVLLGLLEKEFVIKKKYDTKTRLEVDQFGYSSIHCILAVPENWLSVPQFSNFSGFNIEVQVRTLAQHVWAEAAHVLHYKRDSELSISARRTFGRLSAVLEIVDDELDRSISSGDVYLNHGENSEDLNVENLKEILNAKMPEINRKNDEDYEKAFEKLSAMGIQGTKELLAIIDDGLEGAKKFEQSIYRGLSGLGNDQEYFELMGQLFSRNYLKEMTPNGGYHNQIGMLGLILRQRKERKEGQSGVDE